MPSSLLPSIYDFLDYRKYLEAYYTGKKALVKGYSYRLFCRKAEINSPGYLSEVLSGRRNLSRAYVHRFAKAMDLDAQEIAYFELLVAFNHARTEPLKQDLYDLLLKASPLEIRKPRRSQLDYFSKWYHVAVREALAIHPVKDDATGLAAFLRPPITPAQARAALDLLARLELIERDGEGYWRAKHRSLVTRGDESETLLYRAFRKEMLGRGLEALDTVPASRQNASCITLSVSGAGMDRILSHLEEFHKRVIETVQNDKEEDRVVQVNVQVFPLTALEDSHASNPS
jgi:uncharacterized protein (TIGR02147 family)